MRRATVASVAVLAGLLAGCTSGGSGPSGSSPPASLSSSPPVTAASSTPPTVPPLPSLSVVPTGSDLPTVSSAPPSSGNTCTSSGLALSVVPASGASGVQYALVAFTNSGSAPCTLTGFPGVALLVGGKPVGTPAENSSTPVTTVTVAPGGAAQARVASYSTCNAPESDSLRVTLPGTTAFVDVAGQLRACRLVVDAITAA